MEKIESIVEHCLEEMSKNKSVMMFPGEIPAEMLDDTIKPNNDWKGWKPTKSIIEDSDLEKLEAKIGYKLPQSYKIFLKYKHFYELRIPDHAVSFPSHLPDKNLSSLLEYVFEYMDPDQLIGKGYIYFADFCDYGLLCFDTNEKVEKEEYPIVYIDHENLEMNHRYANHFLELLEGDEETGNRFIDKLNSFYE